MLTVFQYFLYQKYRVPIFELFLSTHKESASNLYIACPTEFNISNNYVFSTITLLLFRQRYLLVEVLTSRPTVKRRCNTAINLSSV